MWNAWLRCGTSAPCLRHRQPTPLVLQTRLWWPRTPWFGAATLDASSGPIVVGFRRHRVEPGSHIEGPVIHRHAVVRAGAHVRGATVIGPHSKVGGELSNVNFQGWANKAHGGFLGNSVIGRWCNLGAGNGVQQPQEHLRLGPAMVGVTGQMEDTGLQFCGVLMGDHTKCGIGTTLNTGTILGPACVVFDAGFPPSTSPFSPGTMPNPDGPSCTTSRACWPRPTPSWPAATRPCPTPRRTICQPSACRCHGRECPSTDIVSPRPAPPVSARFVTFPTPCLTTFPKHQVLLSDDADDQLSIPLLSSEDEAAMERESTPEDLPILPSATRCCFRVWSCPSTSGATRASN